MGGGRAFIKAGIKGRKGALLIIARGREGRKEGTERDTKGEQKTEETEGEGSLLKKAVSPQFSLPYNKAHISIKGRKKADRLNFLFD